VLIYVWAIEQDELSKRSIPTRSDTEEQLAHRPSGSQGQDVFVPWVLSPASSTRKPEATVRDMWASENRPALPASEHVSPKIFHRYYHMFGQGELSALVREAATELGLDVGTPSAADDSSAIGRRGVEIVQEGWERSNYYVELRCWES